MSSINPFKPGQPIDPQFFGGRRQEQQLFNEYLRYTASGNPHHIAIMGERGIGKSSLLRKYGEMAGESGCIVVRRELDTTVNSIQALVVFMLQALRTDGSSNLPKKMKAKHKIESFFSSYKLGASIFGTGMTIERIQPSVIPQDAFCRDLMQIWNGIKNDVSAVVFLLDEAEHLQEIKGAWGFLRSVFTRVSEQGGRYMLVVSGKLGLFKGIKEIFSPMERFFTPLEVKPMMLEEIKEVLEKPLAPLSRRIDGESVRRIAQLSAGNPYVVQTFGFYLFEEGTASIERKTIEKVLPRVMTRLSSQLFRDRFEESSELERRVLLTMSTMPSSTSPKGLTKESRMSPKVLPQLLRRLVDKGCVRKVERGRYSLFNPLFGDYVKIRMEERR